MHLTLVDGDAIASFPLPEKRMGQYWVTRVEDSGEIVELASVEGLNDQWVLKSTRRASVLGAEGEPVRSAVLEPDVFYGLRIAATGTDSLLYCEPSTLDRREMTRRAMPASGVIRIGRASGCEIRFNSRFASTSQASISIDGDAMTITDGGSANGTFVNGRRVTSGVLNPGDVVWIVGLTLIVGRGVLALNNPDGLVECDERVLPALAEPEIRPVLDEIEEVEPSVPFLRTPRFASTHTPQVFRIDGPPQPDRMDTLPAIMVLGSAITMGIASALIGVFTVYNVTRNPDRDIIEAMPALVMSFSMLMGMVMWPVLNKRYERREAVRREELRKERYREYLGTVRARMDEERAAQSKARAEGVPTLASCLERVRTRGSGLWERTPGDDDFCEVRVGLGDLPMQAEMAFPEKRFSVDEDCLVDEMLEVANTPVSLESVPVTVSLVRDPVVGVIGDPPSQAALMRGLILQLAALHSYDELRMAFILSEAQAQEWGWVRWLPHSWASDESIRLVATTPRDMKGLSAHLEAEIASRLEKAATSRPVTSPRYVIVVLDPALASKAQGVQHALRLTEDIGFSVIGAFTGRRQLPKECSAVVEVKPGAGYLAYKAQGVGAGVAFVPDASAAEAPEDVVRALANTRIDTAAGSYRLPQAINFLEMFQVGRVEHLNVLSRWAESNPVLSLEAPIGVDSSGSQLRLDLHEKYHGPHGLIAGMTGSGKSELIMTFILSLAVNYHPHEVAFVLIDYKGGGMANAFATLPHVVGTITNLDGSEVSRSLISIQSELKRRQALFNSAAEKSGQSNIDIYAYQRLHREGFVDEPLPHLMIISDEFAELKAQQPEFMAQLVSAARIGRSLGVHLILATQKPSGVVDEQIWSNSRFRICLKVQEKADSIEVIKRPDAAELSVAGRFYLQVGFNEMFETGQSAWAGAGYIPSDSYARDYDDSVTMISMLGQPVRQERGERGLVRAAAASKQLDSVTAYLRGVADGEGIESHRLWLEPIAPTIFQDEIRRKYAIRSGSSAVLDPVVGVYDDPACQRQAPLTVPLTREGNAVIYGSAGSGKAQFVTSLIWSLLQSHTPDQVNIYVLDFGAETLQAFRSAPHVGDVLLSHDAEKILNLMKMLTREMSRRKVLLAETGGDYAAYRGSDGESLPAVVTVVHNYAAFAESYPDAVEALVTIAREGLRHGLFVVLSASGSSDVRYQMLQSFKQVFVLQFNDPVDYAAVLGKTGGMRPSPFRGRGLVRLEELHEFQIARPASGVEDDIAFVRAESTRMAGEWTGPVAPPAPSLPATVTPQVVASTLSRAAHGAVPVGIDVNSLEVVTYDFSRRFGTWVLSQEADDASFIQAVAEMLGTQIGSDCVVLDPGGLLVDPQGAEYGHVPRARSQEAVVALFERLAERTAEVRSATAEGRPLPEFAPIVVVICSHSRLSKVLDADGKDKLASMLEHCTESVGLHVVLFESAADAQRLTFEPWGKSFSSSHGVWLGEGFIEQGVLKVTSGRADLYREVGMSAGYVVDKGRPRLVRTVAASASLSGGERVE